MDDPEEAVAVLARTHEWQEALRKGRGGGREGQGEERGQHQVGLT